MSDYNNGGQRPAPRPTNALNNQKLKLWASNGAGKNASLSFGFVGNNPRINVYTNIENDRDNGRISANMDIPVFIAFLNILKQAIDFKPTEATPDFKVKIENKRPNFKPGAEKGSKVTESELWVGKDNEGVVWLSVTAYQRPKIKFPFSLSDYHALQHSTGEFFTKGEASVLCAKAYHQFLMNLIPIFAHAMWEEPKKKEGQGGGGNYNRGGGNGGGGGGNYNRGGGGSAPADDFSDGGDDIPF